MVTMSRGNSMDLISLVKDSFEAVVHEVESAYQRVPATDEQESDERSADSSVTGTATLERTTVDVAARSEATPVSAATDGDSAAATVEPSATDSPTVTTETEESRTVPEQYQILADVLQQAAVQLSTGVADSDEATDEPEDLAYAELCKEQSELKRLYESRIHSDEVQARTLERLHQELQESRSQLMRAEMAPLLKDIIFCHDFVTREVERDDEQQEVHWRKSFEMLGQMLLDVLFKYDVEPFRSEGDEFDRSQQQCVKTEHTTDSERDRRIATHGLSGFRSGDSIIRREQVTVYRFRPSG